MGVNAVAAFSDEEFLVARADGDILVVDSRTGTGDSFFGFAEHPSSVEHLAVDPKGEYVAAAGKDGRVALWQRAVESAPGEAGVPGRFTSPDVLITADDVEWNSAVRVEWTQGGEYLMTFAPDWLHGEPRAPVQLWSREGESVWKGGRARWAVTSPTAPLVATVQRDEVLLFWPGEREQRITLEGALDSIDFSPDGARVVVGGTQDRLWILDAATGEELLATKIGFMEGVLVAHPTITRLHWSPTGDWIGGTVGKGCNAVLVDPATGKTKWSAGMLGARMWFVFDAYWSSDGQRFVYGFGRSSWVDMQKLEASPLPLGEPHGMTAAGGAEDDAASILLADGMTARVRHRDGAVQWCRVEVEHGRSLLQGPSGHVTGAPNSSRITYSSSDRRDRTEVPLRAAFSPRRVAASLDGVAVRPLRASR